MEKKRKKGGCTVSDRPVFLTPPRAHHTHSLFFFVRSFRFVSFRLPARSFDERNRARFGCFARTRAATRFRRLHLFLTPFVTSPYPRLVSTKGEHK